MIGDEINCLKNIGPLELTKATSYCQSLNASQILPRSRQESDDFVSALLSLDLASENGNTLVSIGIYKQGSATKTGKRVRFRFLFSRKKDFARTRNRFRGFRA